MLSLTLQNVDDEISFDYSEQGTTFDFEMSVGSGTSYPEYQGEYEVTPKVALQILETANKLMTQNVKVLKIPKTEAHNTYGTTLTIGGTL